jgi:hypothetical protein
LDAGVTTAASWRAGAAAHGAGRTRSAARGDARDTHRAPNHQSVYGSQARHNWSDGPLSRLCASAMCVYRPARTQIADYWPGPVWLYHAPGSGVWWDPGRRVVARNLIDGILRFHNLSVVVAHIERVGNGDRRLNRYRAYVQWRAAFGGTWGPSWATSAYPPLDLT